jgi:hypothetical protein
MWPLLITFFLVTAFLIFKVAEAMWELDNWISETDKRWAGEYDYLNDKFVKKPTPKPEPTPEPVKKLTPSLENFPKSTEDAKVKIERLLKKSA